MINGEEIKFKDDKAGDGSFIIRMIVDNDPKEVVAQNLYTKTAAKSKSNKLNKDYKGKSLEEIREGLGLEKNKTHFFKAEQKTDLGSDIGLE
jgi:hypothetical protein